MKILIKIVVLLFLPLFTFSQSEIALDNNITGIYSNSNSKNLELSANGQNYISYKKLSISSNTFYLLSLNDQISNKITGNELMQRFSIDRQSKSIYKFVFYQYNSSMLRDITSENWIGIGVGIKKKIKNSTFNSSYAIMYDNKNRTSEIWRHSLKLKYKIEKKLFAANTEYFFQPAIKDLQDLIIIGSTSVVIFPEKKINFLIQYVLNIRTIESIKVLETLTIGIGMKFEKKFEKKK